MKKLEKMAAQDAYDYGFAQMFFGEGAGTRRKLVGAKIQGRRDEIPGYDEAFDAAFALLNQTEMAEKALAHRKNLDRAAKTGKNIRALKNGNMRGLSTGVFIIVGGVWLAHETGYDEVIKRKVTNAYKDLKIEIRVRKARMQGRNVTKIYG